MHKKQLSELISRISRALEITLISFLVLMLILSYQIGISPQGLKLCLTILCCIALLRLCGRTHSAILFSVIVATFYIYVPVHWGVYILSLTSFSLLYLMGVLKYEDYIFDKAEYLKNIVTLKNEIILNSNASSLPTPTLEYYLSSLGIQPPYPPCSSLHGKIILHDQVTTVTIKNTYLIWKHPIKNKEGILTRHKLLSEQMAKLSPPILDTTVLKEVKQESKKYFFIFCHDIIRISYDMPIDTIAEETRIVGGMHHIIVSRKQYSRLTEDLINHIVKTLKNTPELEYLVRRGIW